MFYLGGGHRFSASVLVPRRYIPENYPSCLHSGSSFIKYQTFRLTERFTTPHQRETSVRVMSSRLGARWARRKFLLQTL